MQISAPDDRTALAAIGALLPDAPTREQIETFAGTVLAAEADGPVEINTLMHLAHGVAGRSIVLPRGAVLVGLPHKHSGLAVCVGDITVWTEEGRQRLTGAHILTTKPGSYRVGLAHADTTWMTVHANETGGQDIKAIEDSLVEGAHRLLTRRLALEIAP